MYSHIGSVWVYPPQRCLDASYAQVTSVDMMVGMLGVFLLTDLRDMF